MSPIRSSALLPALVFSIAITAPVGQATAQVGQATAQGEAIKNQYQQQAQGAKIQADAQAAQAAAQAATQKPSTTQVNAAPKQSDFTPAENAIIAQIKTLRATPDAERGTKTSVIAKQIGDLPGGINKLRLADSLCGLATEGDFGHEMLQNVADMLTTALVQNPLVTVAAPGKRPGAARPYLDLAKLVRYEHVTSTLSSPEYTRAQATLVANEADIEKADFTLTDLSGKSWTLSALRGKVVLVNFWATWCPPCRKEMPDLDALSARFADKGLVVLSLSDEDDRAKVAAYVSSHNINYPILLDPGGKAKNLFHVDGIPKTFLFDRTGKLTAQSIDMRTQGQFLQMLAQAGIQ